MTHMTFLSPRLTYMWEEHADGQFKRAKSASGLGNSVLLMPNSTLKRTRGSLRRQGVIISLGRERGGVYMQYPTKAVKGVI